MAENSNIEWCDHTFNPWTGCTKVSPGCDGCYAEAWAKRSGAVQWGPGAQRRRTTLANWRLPVKWNAQAQAQGRRFRVFCASLADVFDNSVDVEWRDDLFALIRETPHLDWLLLTKRIGNARSMIDESLIRLSLSMGFDAADLLGGWPWPNVWLGASVVNQEEADRDIHKLLQVPARVRFLSIEPMLGLIDLTRLVLKPAERPERGQPPVSMNALHGWHGGAGDEAARLHWVICGGESGPGARPMHPDWARSLRDQCAAAGVPFLFKQWGEWAPPAKLEEMRFLGDAMRAGKAIHVYGAGREPDGHFRKGDDHLLRIGKKAAGRLLDGVEHNWFPESEARG